MKSHPLAIAWLEEDEGSILGYYSKGHHDAPAFLYAVGDYAPDLSYAEGLAQHVSHVWFRCRPGASDDGFPRTFFDRAVPHSRGAFPATYVDVEQWQIDQVRAAHVEVSR